MDLTTHCKVDLDAILAVFLYVKCILGKTPAEVTLHFVNAGQTGPGVNLDTGLGEFAHHQTKNGGDCAASLVWQSLPAGNDKEASQLLVAMALAQDIMGSVFPTGICVIPPKSGIKEQESLPEYLTAVATLQAELSGLHTLGLSDQQIIEHFWLTFEGLLALQKNRLQADREYQVRATQVTEHIVFLDFGRDTTLYYQLMGRAFRKEGALAVIYRFAPSSKSPGHGFGIKCRNYLRVDLNQLQGWIAGQETGWFFHPGGFLACKGDPKKPRTEPSVVDPKELAGQFEELLKTSTDPY